jgi:capsular exopolysaccharide synthesis family protein
MGKIFDALKKSETENVSLLITRDSSVPFSPSIPDSDDIKREDYSCSVSTKHDTDSFENIIVQCEPVSAISDQFRILRTQILRKCRETNSRSILVTSAMPREGKTTIATNLASGIAQCINDKSILLDFDLRKKNVSKLFKMNGKLGILNFLTDTLELSDIIHKTEIPNMLVIGAGKSTRHPSDIISPDKVDRLITDIKAHYQDHYIIIDSSPIELTPEVNILADKIDAMLFVISAGFTKREQIANAIKKVDRNKIFGVVLNGIDQRLSSYKSYYKSYYTSYDIT